MINFKRKLIKLSELFTFTYPRSFAQEGEDMLMKEIFFKQKNGFFVDIGAHHPKRFSNTYHYYKLGWRGINIDAMPGSMRLFNIYRKRDINLELGIAEREGEMTFYVFDEPAINTFSKEIAESKTLKNRLIAEKKVMVFPLAHILEKYAPQKIDFMSIDVEGLDLQVLKTNNWERFQPRLILVESVIAERKGNPDEIASFLFQKGYRFFAATQRTTLFIKDE